MLWQTDRAADQVLTIEPLVVLVAGNRLEARAAPTGSVLWQSELGDLDSPSQRVDASRAIAIGQRIFIATGPTLFAVDRRTGIIEMTLRLDGDLLDLAGPPLVASVRAPDGAVRLMALDPDHLRLLAQRPLPAAPGPLLVTEGVAIAVDPASGTILGLDGDELRERWRSEPQRAAALFEIDGRLFVDSVADEGRHRWRQIDALSGLLGPALTAEGSASARLLPELDVRPTAGGFLVERRPLIARRPPWKTWLPCRPRIGAVRRGQLFLACDLDTPRDFVLLLDWRSGAVQRVWHGFERVQSIHFAGDLVLASTSSRVVAFDADQAAAPAAESSALEAAIGRILAQPIAVRPDRSGASVGEDQQAQLEALGEPARTALLQRLPALSDGAFAAAAQVLARAQTRAAAPIIAQRATALALAESRRDGVAGSGSPPDRVAHLDALLRALGRIGGDDGLAVSSAVLQDRRQSPAIRRRALRTLVQLKLTAADAAAILFLERSRPPGRGRWWRPLEHWPRPGAERDSLALLGRHLEDDAGGRWVLLRGGPFGDNGHLWLIQTDAGGRAVSFGMLGQRCPNRRVDGGATTGAIADAEWSADRLRLRCAGDRERFEIGPAAVLADRDGDGINDKAEELLHLNPLAADSDGDGIVDSEDLTANGREGEPVLESDQIVAAIVRERFGALGDAGPAALTLVIHPGAFNWETAETPLLTFHEEELAYYCEATGCAGLPQLSVAPAPDCDSPGNGACRAHLAYAARRPLDPDQRIIVRRLRGGPFGDEEAAVLVRKVGRLWVVEEEVALERSP
ncbi:MAG: PQQ-binding-like beta-propeller repeat protein [Deltaproteobacteria bacterium]|nr:PQQ-binding-like beta-propeller repeat protein [Deltaproteobacteria bacterium]